MPQQLLNFINGRWQRSSAGSHIPVTNPATAAVIAEAPLRACGESKEMG